MCANINLCFQSGICAQLILLDVPIYPLKVYSKQSGFRPIVLYTHLNEESPKDTTCSRTTFDSITSVVAESDSVSIFLNKFG